MERNPSLCTNAAISLRSTSVTLASIALIFATSGCYSYNPYGYGYGGNYMSPYGAAAPTTVMPANPAMQQPSGAYITPGDFNSQPALSQQPTQIVQPQQWKNSKAGPAPGADVFESPKDNSVPNYQDPNGGADDTSPSADQSDGDEFSPFQSSRGDASDTSLTQEKFDVADNSVVLGEPITDDEEFAAPVQTKSVSVTKTLEGAGDEESKRPNPYAYDTERHSWLRGVVDFDEQDKSWHIIYSLNPDVSDPYAGDMTLIDHPDLKFLKTDDVVLVHGQVDSKVTDRIGKPSYRIKKIELLKPKK